MTENKKMNAFGLAPLMGAYLNVDIEFGRRGHTKVAGLSAHPEYWVRIGDESATEFVGETLAEALCLASIAYMARGRQEE